MLMCHLSNYNIGMAFILNIAPVVLKCLCVWGGGGGTGKSRNKETRNENKCQSLLYLTGNLHMLVLWS